MRYVIIAAVLISGSARAATAGPIQFGSGYYNVSLEVATSITVVPGETAFVGAVLENTGTLALTFKPWDAALTIGGFGWDFSEPGLAIGNFGAAFSGDYFGETVTLNEGHSNGARHTPDFSSIADVTINPGERFAFDLWSITLSSDALLGRTGSVRTGSQIALGDPVYAGWNSAFYTIDWTTGTAQTNGPLRLIDLTTFSFGPTIPDTTPVPEPASAVLLGVGGVLVFARSWGASRRPRRLRAHEPFSDFPQR